MLDPATLPDVPWDALSEAAAVARAHPGGLVDLSIGSPVDPTPAVVQEALVAAADAHAYPRAAGTPALRAALIDWHERRRGVRDLTDDEVMPTIGSKELIAGLALWLGLGPGDTVVHPRLAYPSYAVGAALAGATALASDDPAEWPTSTRLVWVNSPRNPDGAVLDVPGLRAVVDRARELGAVVAADECYAELGWEGEWSDRPTPSILDPRVVGDVRDGVLAVGSLSKQSNLAGYRAGFVAGDAAVVARLLALRRHAGLVPPAPVQAAMVAALGDDAHVAEQKEAYRTRRVLLAQAVTAAGFRVEGSEAGLFLWATRDEGAWRSVAWLARRGVLVSPGSFSGPGGDRHVRVALTASDERVRAALDRLIP